MFYTLRNVHFETRKLIKSWKFHFTFYAMFVCLCVCAYFKSLTEIDREMEENGGFRMASLSLNLSRSLVQSTDIPSNIDNDLKSFPLVTTLILCNWATNRLSYFECFSWLGHAFCVFLSLLFLFFHLCTFPILDLKFVG